ncbi:hypothetical protein SAY87_027454 [Trapa incisa]|uniref:Uncharacterized protein n=1 Tax=Trapa incisa TaxID=236973 RepID=A0AAN7GNC7_9MYRT|nr:hypothetical protein SAY87_027454 [Trapa incisa]
MAFWKGSKLFHSLPFVFHSPLRNAKSLFSLVEHEVLEREIGRLRALYQQQQQQQQKPPSSCHRRSPSKDLDSQFGNLSVKHKDQNSSPNEASGPLTYSL